MGTKSRNLDSIIKAQGSAGCSLCFPPFNFSFSVCLSLTPPHPSPIPTTPLSLPHPPSLPPVPPLSQAHTGIASGAQCSDY
ncbi:hypothetical protein QQF64_014222 [Cirrhinus molitorella]|uniref:Uncharacterized protein n=1 Tax=Cirrhinus molitorella TaxID=172907 RepID=A0ABR3LTD4_9TELE